MTKKLLILNAALLIFLMSNTALTSAREGDESDDDDPALEIICQQLANHAKWLQEDKLAELQVEVATFDKSGKVKLSWEEALHRLKIYERIQKLEAELSPQ